MEIDQLVSPHQNDSASLKDKISVFLIDDHTLFRSGVVSLLQKQQGIRVVGESSDGLDGLKRAKQCLPDVILLDLHLPGLSGIDLLPMLLEEIPTTHVIMLTVSEDSEDLFAALKAGAQGYLLKNINTDFLIQAIKNTVEGEAVLSPQMTKKLMNKVCANSIEKTESLEENKFSSRERQILACLADGQSNKEIARDLFLAESTVKIHIQNILKKLNMSSRVQAAVYAVTHRLTKT